MFMPYFLVYDHSRLEWALQCWSFMGMIGHFDAGPLWACVKVDYCCDPSFTGTLTHVTSIENLF
jgi:hypothetical protein